MGVEKSVENYVTKALIMGRVLVLLAGNPVVHFIAAVPALGEWPLSRKYNHHLLPATKNPPLGRVSKGRWRLVFKQLTVVVNVVTNPVAGA